MAQHVSTLSMNRADEKVLTLAQRHGIDLVARDNWDIRLSSRSEDSIKGKPVMIAYYERNTKRTGDEHWAAVYKTLAEDPADVIRMTDEVKGKTTVIYYTKEYIEKAYQVCTLGLTL